MNVGSLFSGIGGMDHGLARAGFTHRFFCESDEWRRTVLAHHWPGVPIYEDVRDVGVDALRGSHISAIVGDRKPDAAVSKRNERDGAIDLLCGGFPCQDLSVAGQRRGLAGARSGLFFEFARIAESVQPRWLLIENVPGLLSSNGGRDFGVVLGTLADIGYGVGWRVVDSRFFGVPQRRRRVFIVGTNTGGDTRASAQRAGEVLAVGTRCPGHPPTGGQTGQGVAAVVEGRPDLSSKVSGTLGSLTNHGNGGGPRTTDLEGSNPAFGINGMNVRRLTPTECGRLQALPDDWTAHGPDSRRYAALGDAVTSTVAEWIGRRLMKAAA